MWQISHCFIVVAFLESKKIVAWCVDFKNCKMNFGGEPSCHLFLELNFRVLFGRVLLLNPDGRVLLHSIRLIKICVREWRKPK
jgi:hypothetical protein